MAVLDIEVSAADVRIGEHGRGNFLAKGAREAGEESCELLNMRVLS